MCECAKSPSKSTRCFHEAKSVLKCHDVLSYHEENEQAMSNVSAVARPLQSQARGYRTIEPPCGCHCEFGYRSRKLGCPTTPLH